MSCVTQIYFNKKCDQVTLKDIQKLIDEQVIEDYTLDYKEIPKNPQYGSYGKIISSFLNTNGGLLIIGVSERSKKYPDKITWGKISKETLVRSLFRIVDPWSSEIIIHPIENPDDEREYIFVVDVPKSKTPPHMANGVYYYRNVFESIPMTHSQVKGILTESHIQKEKIIERVIQPLYVQVTRVMEKSDPEQYPFTIDPKGILSENRYLYDQINENLREKIETFFEWIEKRYDSIHELRNNYSDCMKNIIVTFLKGSIKLEDIIKKVDLLEISVQVKERLKTGTHYPKLFECILTDKPPINEPVVSIDAEIKGYQKLTEEEFHKLYKELYDCTRKSEYYPKWRDSIQMIDELGPKLLEHLKNY